VDLGIAAFCNLNGRKMNRIFWSMGFATILMIGLLASCKSTKTIQTAINKRDTVAVTEIKNPIEDSTFVINRIIEKIYNRRINFNTFSAKIKLDYTDPEGKTKDATVFIRLNRDSVMWVSLTGALGVEGFRVLIKPDSVFVLDKLEKNITRRSTGYLQEITNLPLDFAALQDIIVGNPVYFSNNIVSYKADASSVTALSVGDYFKHLLNLDTLNNTIGYSKIDDINVSRNRTCFITYSNYTPAQGTTFSTNREITVTEKTSLNVKLEYKQFAFDEKLTFPFAIPKNYKEK
jgi:hypothetical protein